MKTLLKCILILCFPAMLQAQETTPNPYELGLDITQVINLFNTETSPSGRFSARRLGNKSAIRAGLGFSFSIENDVNANTSSEMKIDRSSYSITPSIGYEWHTPLVKKWTLYYGGDVGYVVRGFYSESYDETRSFSNEALSTSKGVSLSPLLGIRFTLNDRISFVTESKFTTMYLNTKRETTVSSPGNRRTTSNDDNTFSGNFYAPLSLYLLIKL